MLDTIVNSLAYGSLLFVATAAYLQLNKVWARKHIEDVAASISIPGILVESVPLFFFGLYYLQKGELVGIVDSTIWLVTATVFILIGAGFWVPGQRRQGLAALIRRSVRMEQQELTTLANAVIHPVSEKDLIEILSLVAAVDGEIDDREKQLIDAFAQRWKLHIDWAALQKPRSLSDRIIAANEAVEAYLQTTPSTEQVRHLLDLLQLIVAADAHTSPEEQTLINEVRGGIMHYREKASDAPGIAVVIAPQSRQQDEAIRRLLNTSGAVELAGGKGHKVGEYFSRTYARLVCEEYRALGFFTVLVDD